MNIHPYGEARRDGTSHRDGDGPAVPDPGLSWREFSFPEGTVYVTVRPAQAVAGRLLGRLEIGSRPEGDTGERAGYLMLNGRRHSLAASYTSTPARLGHIAVSGSRHDDTGQDDRAGDGGGVHHLRRSCREWTALRDLALCAVAAFTGEQPGWRHDSARLYWLRERVQVIDTITQLRGVLGVAEVDLRRIDTALHTTPVPDTTLGATTTPAATTRAPKALGCAVLSCDGEGTWQVHVRHRNLDFDVIELMCRDHAHRVDSAFDVLPAQPIPAGMVEGSGAGRS